jgi:hypothetical protein
MNEQLFNTDVPSSFLPAQILPPPSLQEQSSNEQLITVSVELVKNNTPPLLLEVQFLNKHESNLNLQVPLLCKKSFPKMFSNIYYQ